MTTFHALRVKLFFTLLQNKRVTQLYPLFPQGVLPCRFITFSFLYFFWVIFLTVTQHTHNNHEIEVITSTLYLSLLTSQFSVIFLNTSFSNLQIKTTNLYGPQLQPCSGKKNQHIFHGCSTFLFTHQLSNKTSPFARPRIFSLSLIFLHCLQTQKSL